MRGRAREEGGLGKGLRVLDARRNVKGNWWRVVWLEVGGWRGGGSGEREREEEWYR